MTGRWTRSWTRALCIVCGMWLWPSTAHGDGNAVTGDSGVSKALVDHCRSVSDVRSAPDVTNIANAADTARAADAGDLSRLPATQQRPPRQPRTQQPRRSLVCGNVWVQAELVPIFEELLAASPTLRHQVASIRAMPRLTVSVTRTDTCDVYGAPCHARTHFARYESGGTIAQVRIRRDTNLADAMGHELEHIREWSEGTLRRLFGLRRDGRDDTERARLAGERVRDEHARWLRRYAR